MLYADTSFFDMFGVTLLSGDDPKQALTDLNNIYLSESAARRIFGDEDPVGKIMTRQEVFFRVAGVFKDFPKNSHIGFDAVSGLANAVRLDGSFYGWNGGDSYIGYIKLSPETDPKAVEAKLLDALQKYHDFKEPLEDAVQPAAKRQQRRGRRFFVLRRRSGEYRKKYIRKSD